MGKNLIQKIKLNSIKDNKKFDINAVELLYSLPLNSFTLINDENNNVYLAKIINFNNKKIDVNDDEFKNYKEKQNSNNKKSILKSYDILLSEKYEMVLDENRSLIAIQGPKSSQILNEVVVGVKDLNFMSGNWFSFENQKVYITRSGYTGEDGFEISISNDFADKLTRELINKGSKLVGLGARDTLRLEAGLCLYGHDLDKDKTPVEANLKWAISKERISKGDFIGSDIIIKQLNNGVTKIRVGIKPEGRIIAREKTKIFNQSDVHIGEITSGTFGPSVNGPVAMGYVENQFSKKDTKVFLEVRGKKHAASICSLPFYKKSYVKGAN